MRELSSPRPCLQGDESLRAAACSGTGIRVRNEHGSALRYLVALLVLITPPSLARAQESSPSQTQTGDPYTIKVSVGMVVLHATAQDHKHTLVSGLDKDDFQIYEDRVPQQIKYFSHEDIPVTVGLVVDNSGSMKPKHPDVVAAALAFA